MGPDEWADFYEAIAIAAQHYWRLNRAVLGPGLRPHAIAIAAQHYWRLNRAVRNPWNRPRTRRNCEQSPFGRTDRLATRPA